MVFFFDEAHLLFNEAPPVLLEKIEQVMLLIRSKGVGEALISLLDAKGSPSVMERAMVIAPSSHMGPLNADEGNGLINHSPLYGKYDSEFDRESAFERLQQGFQASSEQTNAPPDKGTNVAVDEGILGGLAILFWPHRTARRQAR